MKNSIPFTETPIFNLLIQSYLNEEVSTRALYHLFPTLENFEKQIQQKKLEQKNRDLLVNALTEQYQNIDNKEFSFRNIQLLKEENTFTITTGHQLNLFTGPVYFVYKILSTIKLCEVLKQKYPTYHFVPIYWMASEDHDFEEINHFHPGIDQKIVWEKSSGDAVGKMDLKDMENVYKSFEKSIGQSEYKDQLTHRFQESYLSENLLSDATKKLVHRLFGSYGLVVLDADRRNLKKSLIPIIKKELLEKTTFHTVRKTNEGLKKLGFDIQVNPREINLFYLHAHTRSRIFFQEGTYQVLGTSIIFTEKEILEEVTNYPEKFSPNVLLRPIYQEVILPNLSYIGGGGEMSYWLQLKKTFETFEVTFPILLLRNSALWITEKQAKKWSKIGLEAPDLFISKELITDKILARHQADRKLYFKDLHLQILQLAAPYKDWFSELEPTYVPAIESLLKRHEKDWKHWDQKVTKTIKKKHQDAIERAHLIHDELYPKGILQERYLNFSFWYQYMGQSFFDKILQAFDPLSHTYNIFIHKTYK